MCSSGFSPRLHDFFYFTLFFCNLHIFLHISAPVLNHFLLHKKHEIFYHNLYHDENAFFFLNFFKTLLPIWFLSTDVVVLKVHFCVYFSFIYFSLFMIKFHFFGKISCSSLWINMPEIMSSYSQLYFLANIFCWIQCFICVSCSF